MSRKTKLIRNLNGKLTCLLYSDNTVSGGGAYLTRVLAARLETNADEFVFVMPEEGDKDAIARRIQKTFKDLQDSVAPMRLPFDVSVSYVSL